MRPSLLPFVRRAIAVALLGAGAWFSVVELYESGHIRFNYPSTTRYPVRGIDVSHHQGQIDWMEVGSTEVQFAFIKASEGADHRDSRFVENWNASAAVGIARGAYHFFTFCTPGDLQAENFLELLRLDLGELPAAADVEFAGNCRNWTSIAEIRSELRVFLEKVTSATGRRPLLYAPRDAYTEIVAGHFDDYELWLRNVVGAPQTKTWKFWQYADNGPVAGITGKSDLNVFHGTGVEFQELLSPPES